MHTFISLAQVDQQARAVVEGMRPVFTRSLGAQVFGVPRGGLVPAYAVVNMANRMHMPRPIAQIVDHPSVADIIIDDVRDSGDTERRFIREFPHIPFVALFDKGQEPWLGKWLVFPWEIDPKAGADTSGDDIVVRLLQLIGEDPNREGLRETPRRFIAAWREWTSGYGQDPREVMKTFEDGATRTDEMVVVHGIPIVSKCEHHLADIIGVADIGYVPDGRILGLSKLFRVADIFSRRLQVQERLANDIADALAGGPLAPKGVAVLIRATHACIATRGVKAHNSTTTTCAMRGVFMTKPETRAEFMAHCRNGV